jgi:hypothetical protein
MEEQVTQHMHQEAAIDSSVIKMSKPVNAQVVAAIAAISPETGTRIYPATVNGIISYDARSQTSISSRVAGRVERLLVRYNYQPVRKGQLIMEIYSPDLVAAQREMLYVAHNSSALLGAAKQRLLLLGMPQAQVEQVLKTGNVIYRIPVYSNSNGYILEKSSAASLIPAPAFMPTATAGGGGPMGGMAGGETTSAAAGGQAVPAAAPVLLREGQYVSAGQSLFTIYNAQSLVAEFAFPSRLAASISKGQQILFFPAGEEPLQSGSIGLIEPVFREGVNFMLARVYLRNSTLRVGQLLTASVPVVYRKGWWLPGKAVWHLGNKSVVFRKQQGIYVPVEVETGAIVKDMVQVNTDIGDWQVAANAYYLVDSESFIKTNH